MEIQSEKETPKRNTSHEDPVDRSINKSKNDEHKNNHSGSSSHDSRSQEKTEALPLKNKAPQKTAQTVHKKDHFGIWISVAIFVMLTAGLYYFLGPRAAKKAAIAKAHQAQPHAIPIESATAHKGDIKIFVRALGTVIPVHSISAVSQVQGQILSVNFREGQAVKKGDLLVKIDPRPYEAALAVAEGQLRKDLSLLKQSQNNLARYKKAYESRAVPEQQVADQEQLYLQNQGIVESDRGSVANAKVNLGYCDIISPIDGQVGLRLIDPGNFVQPNGATPLVVITQMEPITVIFSVAEDNLAQIQEQLGQGQNMSVDAYDRTQQTKISSGKFLAIDNQIDTTTGTVRIRAIFDNKEHTLYPNQFVNAKLLVNTLDGVILIPTVAIQTGPQGPFVYTIQSDKTAKIQQIKVNHAEGDQSAVEGISDGQAIAVNGFDKLQDGVKVIIRNPPEVTKRSPITRR